MSLAHWVKYKPGFYAQILHQYVVLPYRENQQTLELYNFCHLPSRCSHQEVTKILHFAYFCSRVRLFFSSGFWLWIEVLWKQNHWTKLRLIIQTCRHICMALPPCMTFVWHLFILLQNSTYSKGVSPLPESTCSGVSRLLCMVCFSAGSQFGMANTWDLMKTVPKSRIPPHFTWVSFSSGVVDFPLRSQHEVSIGFTRIMPDHHFPRRTEIAVRWIFFPCLA